MYKQVLPTICIMIFLCGCTRENTEYAKTIFAMDTVMDLKIYSGSGEVLSKAETEIRRIESLLDRGNDSGEIYKINRDKSADVSAETAELIHNAVKISDRCGGAFDITVSPLMDLWGFYGLDFRVPTEDDIKTALKGVGYRNIRISGNNISVPQNTSVDLGGIGKGYTSDHVTELLKENGVKSAIISLGGNVQTLGSKPDGNDWTVGIANPFNQAELIGKVKVSDKAVITSGGYQRYFEKDGKMYHHILDPKTGMSAENGLSSVTIISDSGATADGLSTALFVMGLEYGIALWRESDDFDAVWVDNNGTVYVTDGISDKFESDVGYTVISK